MTVKLNKVTKTYSSGEIKVDALLDVTMEIKDGEFLSIAGPSGSGKTTLLNMIGCLDDPTSGEILHDNRNIAELSDNELADFRNHNLGFIFQTFNLIPVLTAYENVEFSLILRGNGNGKMHRKIVEDILTRVGLQEEMHRKPGEMSGGQQQRVAIARALVKNPKIVLADEPTANLDSETATDILALMKKLNEDDNVTFVFSTHDKLVMEFAKRLIILKDGKISSDKRNKK